MTGGFSDSQNTRPLPRAGTAATTTTPWSLEAAATRCPQLLELSLSGFTLAAPAGVAFAHLTRLELNDCMVLEDAPVSCLGALMPRLEVLRCGSDHCGGCGAAAAGHPTLRELHLCLEHVNDPGDALCRLQARAGLSTAHAQCMTVVLQAL